MTESQPFTILDIKPNAHGLTASAEYLAIGDSWFSYMFVGGSLINNLQIALNADRLPLGPCYQGAEMKQFAEKGGKYHTLVKQLFRFHGKGPKALFLSAGGNEFAGFEDLRPLLNDNCTGLTDAEKCFREDDRNTAVEDYTVKAMMLAIFNQYSSLITSALDVMDTSAKVFVHSYDYAIPDGRPAIPGITKPWLLPALIDAKVPEDLRAKCIKHLIDLHCKNMEMLVKRFEGRVVFVDTRNTLEPGELDWANELHPTAKGFEKLVKGKWTEELKANGLIS